MENTNNFGVVEQGVQNFAQTQAVKQPIVPQAVPSQVSLAGPKITSIDDIRQYAQGAVVEFPEFGPDQPFVARVVRPSMLDMIVKEKLPNTLLQKATELFSQGTGNMDLTDKETLKEFVELIEVICEATLIEPRYSDIKAAGLILTDEQLQAIFRYTQEGVKALESFRNQ